MDRINPINKIGQRRKHIFVCFAPKCVKVRRTIAPSLLCWRRHLDESFAGVTYHLEGELVPALTVELNSAQTVYFEHHILLWKHPGVAISIRPMKGAFKRMMAGMQIFTTEAQGTGQISFSRDAAGHVFAMHLKRGDEVHVREHQFLAATGSIDYTFERVKGVANMLFGGTGFFIDKFRSTQERVFFGCMDTATSSKKSSPPAKKSTSNQEPGSTKTPPCA